MAEMVLQTVVWLTVIGLVLFVVFYSLLRPWHDPMGRHILLFMLALALAFFYAVGIEPHLHSRQDQVYGWIITLSLVMAVVWWRLIKLVKAQFEYHETLYQIVEKVKRTLRRK